MLKQRGRGVFPPRVREAMVYVKAHAQNLINASHSSSGVMTDTDAVAWSTLLKALPKGRPADEISAMALLTSLHDVRLVQRTCILSSYRASSTGKEPSFRDDLAKARAALQDGNADAMAESLVRLVGCLAKPSM